MLNELQKRHKIWARKNFGDQESIDYILGVTEEVGELSHAFLKRKQGIRNNEKHNDNINDAVGDIVVFLAGFCNSEGLDFERIVNETWSEVEKRDWKKNPDTAFEDSFFNADEFEKLFNEETKITLKSIPDSGFDVDQMRKGLTALIKTPIDSMAFKKWCEDKTLEPKPFNNDLCKTCLNMSKFDNCDPARDMQIQSCTKFEEDDSKRNLCDSCRSTYPECGSFFLLFGDGKGNDNIYKCAGYEKKKEHLCDTCEHCLSFCSGLIEQIAKRNGILDLDQDVNECSQYKEFVKGVSPV